MTASEKVYLKDRVFFEISGVNREKVEFKVSDGNREMVFEFCADSLFELVMELLPATESVISKLKDPLYLEPEVQQG